MMYSLRRALPGVCCRYRHKEVPAMPHEVQITFHNYEDFETCARKVEAKATDPANPDVPLITLPLAGMRQWLAQNGYRHAGPLAGVWVR